MEAFGKATIWILCVLKVQCGTVSSQTTVLACEGDMALLECTTANEVISVISASYGRTGTSTCVKLGKMTDISCAASGVLTSIKGWCNEQAQCGVDAHNGHFGDPCFGTFKYLTITYDCIASSADQIVTKCEGDTEIYSCPSTTGSYTISVVSVLYGRLDSTTCQAAQMTDTTCSSPTAQATVLAECDGKNSCSFETSNSFFGLDPCDGTAKYSTFNFQCIDSTRGADVSKTTCENDESITPSCSSGVIKVTGALYGRKDSSTCIRSGFITNTDCYTTRSHKTVSTLCDGKTSCTVAPTNANFGDPCPGTYKYLVVSYYCDLTN